MSTADDSCFICKKHSDLQVFTGEPLAEEAGVVLSHFPIIEGAPATQGHLLIGPRRHITDPAEMSEAEAVAMGRLTWLGNRVLKQVLGPEHVYLFRINDKVPHLHFHLVPRYSNTPKEAWGLKIMEWGGAPKIELPGIQDLSTRLAQVCRSVR